MKPTTYATKVLEVRERKLLRQLRTERKINRLLPGGKVRFRKQKGSLHTTFLLLPGVHLFGVTVVTSY